MIEDIIQILKQGNALAKVATLNSWASWTIRLERKLVLLNLSISSYTPRLVQMDKNGQLSFPFIALVLSEFSPY